MMNLATKKSSFDLMYSISPAKKQATRPNPLDHETHMLILAPFNKAPRINFGDVKLSEFAERSLLISNPQEFAVGININSPDLHIENFDLKMEKESSVDLKLKWQPEKAGNYKFSIKIEVADSRLKFIVHGFGNCIEPPKKKIYKKLTVLQPVRQKTSSVGAPISTATKVLKESNTSQPKVPNSSQSFKASSMTCLTKVTKVESQKENKFLALDTTDQFEIVTSGESDYRRHTTNIPTPKSESNCRPAKLEQFEQTTFLSVNNLHSFDHEASNISTSTQILRATSSTSNLTYDKSPALDESTKDDDDELNTTPIFKNDRRRLLEDIAETPVFKPSTGICSNNSINNNNNTMSTNLSNAFIRVENVFAKKERKDSDMNKFYDDIDDEEAVAEKRLEEFRRREIERLEAERLAAECAEKQRIEEERKLKAIVMIQQKVRIMRFRRKIRLYKKSVVKLQRKCREYLEKKRIENERRALAACKIQHWTRSMKERFNFFKIKRIVKRIKQNYLAKKAGARERAALTIQKWHRLMKPRYEYLRLLRATRFIQHTYKVRYERRNMAALKLQNFYRMYKMRQYEREAQNRAASLIQAYWKGYMTRKTVKLEELIRIRQRLSVFIQCRRSGVFATQTLGYRIKKSLNLIIQTDPQPSLHQILQALMELDKVTRLSKECCVIFTDTQGACDLLFQFVSRCNRSIPHIDLINYCLSIMINLAKTPQCLPFIIDAQRIHQHLGMLLYLMQAHYVHTPNLFINVCVLLILITANQISLDYLMDEFRKDTVKNKLIAIYQSLEKRMINKTHAGGPHVQVAFTFEPEWSLSKKNYINFNDSLSALNYLLLNCLQYQYSDCNMSINESLVRTPSKAGVSNTISRLQVTTSSNKTHLKPMEKSHYTAISSIKKKL